MNRYVQQKLGGHHVEVRDNETFLVYVYEFNDLPKGGEWNDDNYTTKKNLVQDQFDLLNWLKTNYLRP